MLSGLHWAKVNFLSVANYTEDYLRAQRGQWGENWRGNWRFDTPQIQLDVQPSSAISAHDKLEAQLELRDWLAAKVTAHQSAVWLGKSLD